MVARAPTGRSTPAPGFDQAPRSAPSEVVHVRRLLVAIAPIALLAGALAWWRRHPRFGSRFVNEVVNPALLRREVPDASQGNIGTLEHVGRRSGIRRLTLVHPVPTEAGFRITVPLGLGSEWARNVLAAGHCRMQVGETIYELDEPALVPVPADAGVPVPIRLLQAWLGFRWLLLRRFAEAPGALDLPEALAEHPAEAGSEAPMAPVAPEAEGIAAPIN